MGAWGTAVFSDDLASDVRGEWRELLLEGVETQEAAAKVHDSFAYALQDEDEAVVFWLALAAAQMETGRLQNEVRDRALEIIDRGGDIARWEEEDPTLAHQRQRVLSRLASKLRGPQPKPKELRRTKPLGVEFEMGDVVLVRAAGGQRRALAVVVDLAESYPPGGRNPVVELLAWDGRDEVPTEQQLRHLPFMVTGDDLNPKPRPHMWVITTHRKADRFGPEIGEVVTSGGIERRPSGDHRSGSALGAVGTSYLSWRALTLYINNERFVEDLRLSGVDI